MGVEQLVVSNYSIIDLIKKLKGYDATQKVVLIHDLDADFTPFFEALTLLEKPLLCSIIHMQDRFQPRFDLQRRQFQIDNQKSIAALTAQVVHAEEKPRSKESPLVARLRRRRQQQQQQPQDTFKPTPKRVRQKSKAVIEIPPGSQHFKADDVITPTNLDAIRDDYDAHVPHDGPSLEEFYARIVGWQASFIRDKKKTITGIHREVMALFIRHHALLRYGFVVDNSPVKVDAIGQVEARVELRAYGEAEYILEWIPASLMLNQEINPYTIVLGPSLPAPSLDDVVGFGRDISSSENLIAWLSELKPGYDSLIRSQLALFLQNYTLLPEPGYRHLAHIVLYAGVEGLLCFLKKANELPDKSLLQPFLLHPQNMRDWATKAGLDRLDRLALLSDIESIWWKALFTQHEAAGAPMDFHVLFDAVEHFFKQQRLDRRQQLPRVFPFTNIANVQSALARLSYLIQKGVPLNRLEHLDLGVLGAHFAMHQEGFARVSAAGDDDMGLTPEAGLLLLHGQKPIFTYDMRDDSLFARAMNLREPNYLMVRHELETEPRHYPRHPEHSEGSPNLAHGLTQEMSGDARHDGLYSKRAITFDDIKRFYVRYLSMDDAEVPLEWETYQKILTAIEAYRLPLRLERGIVPGSEIPHCVRDDGDLARDDGDLARDDGDLARDDGDPARDDGDPARDDGDLARDDGDLARDDGDLARDDVDLARDDGDPARDDSDLVRDDVASVQQDVASVQNDVTQVLDDKTKASLLYICAVAGAGCSTRGQGTPPSEELPAFLEALRGLAERAKVPFSDVVQEIHRHGLDRNTCPTIGQLTFIINEITIPGRVQDKAEYMRSAWFETGFLIKQGIALEIIDNYQAQRKRAPQTPILANEAVSMSLEAPLPDYLTFVSRLGKMCNPSHNSSSSSSATSHGVDAASILPVLSLVQTSDDNFDQGASHFLAQLNTLPPTMRDDFLTQLRDINISTSKSLPHFGHLDDLCREACSLKKTYGSQDRSAQKKAIWNLVTSKIPFCKMGRGPVGEIQLELKTVLRKFTEKPDFSALRGLVTKYVPLQSVKDMGEPALKLLDEFKAKASLEETSEQELLGLLDDIDNELKKLFESIETSFIRQFGQTLGKPAAKKILNEIKGWAKFFNPNMVEKIEAFFNLRSLTIFSEPICAELYLEPMRTQFASLQLGERFKDFENHIFKQVSAQSFTEGEPVIASVVAKSYGERFKVLTPFINSLIRLRNQDAIDFEVYLNRLLIADNGREPSYSVFQFQDFSRLFDVLLKQTKIPITIQLDIILREAVRAPLRLGQVLDGLVTLSEYQETISEEDVRRLFEMSVAHNVQQETAFPFSEVLGLQQSCPEGGASFTEALLKVIHLEGILELTTDTVQANGVEVVPIITLLLKNIHDASDVQTYRDLLGALPKEKEPLACWQKIFAAMDTMQDPKKPETCLSLADLNTIVDRLLIHGHSHYKLSRLCNRLFRVQPYPKNRTFIEQLNKTVDEFDNYQVEFDCWPHEKKMPLENLNTDEVDRIIGGLRRLPNHEPLSESEKLELRRQFDYVNPLFKDRELCPIVKKDGWPGTINLKMCPLGDLEDLAAELIAAFRAAEAANQDPNVLSSPKHRPLTLQMIAVMRAYYCRRTGRMPNAAQLVTWIYALDQPEHQLFQIYTGEGKSITTALFASFLAAKGGAVFVPTATESLANQDFNEKANDRYFAGLKFKAGIIRESSTDEDFDPNGIHYGTVGHLSNYFEKALSKDWLLTKHSSDKLYMVADEYDYILDDSTTFQSSIPLGAENESPYLWVYQAANAFVAEDTYARLDKKDAICQFGMQLENLANASKNDLSRKKEHVAFWSDKLGDLLEDAYESMQYQENRDFYITDKDRKEGDLGYTVAVPLNTNFAPQWGQTFLRYRHNCLHARLGLEKQVARPFIMYPEQRSISSRMGAAFLRLFKVIIGLSGTPGTDNELLEQRDKFGMYATQVPRYKEGSLKTYSPLLVKEKDYDQTIIDIIHYRAWLDYPIPFFAIRYLAKFWSMCVSALNFMRVAMGYTPLATARLAPSLIICETPDEVDALFDVLVAHFGDNVKKMTGLESDKERENRLAEAAKDGNILLGTRYLGRGTDIEIKSEHHPAGLFTMQGFIEMERNREQNSGRSARNGKPGTFMLVALEDETLHSPGILDRLFGPTASTCQARIHDREKELTKQNAIQRHFAQEMDEIQQVIFQHFDDWKRAYLGSSGERRAFSIPLGHEETIPLARWIRQKQSELLEALSICWQQCNEDVANDPTKDWSQDNSEAEKLFLKSAIERFEARAVVLWDETFKPAFKSLRAQVPLSLEDSTRVDLLMEDQLSHLLSYRKLSEHRDEVKKPAINRLNQARIAQRMRFASSAGWAACYYDKERLNNNERKNELEKHARHFLNKASEEFPAFKRLDQDTLKDDNYIPNRFDILLELLLAADTFEKRAPLQELALECIYFHREMTEAKTNLSLDYIDSMSARIQEIQTHYFENSISALTTNLLEKLAFADDTTSFYCSYIEYTKIVAAAKEIRTAARALQEATEENQKECFHNLHQALLQHAQMLQAMWYYFPFGYFFGYTDTLKVIKQTLCQMDEMARFQIFKPNSTLPDAMAIDQEIAQCRAYLSDFWTVLDAMVVVDRDQSWIELKTALREIVEGHASSQTVGHNGLAAVAELIDYLKSESKVGRCYPLCQVSTMDNFRALFRSAPVDAIATLIDKLELIQNQINNRPDTLNPVYGESFLSRKAASIRWALKEKLENLDLYNSITKLEVKLGHTGFEPYYEVVIQSESCNAIELDDFQRDPRREMIEGRLRGCKDALAKLENDILEVRRAESPHSEAALVVEDRAHEQEQTAGRLNSGVPLKRSESMWDKFKLLKWHATTPAVDDVTNQVPANSKRSSFSSWVSKKLHHGSSIGSSTSQSDLSHGSNHARSFFRRPSSLPTLASLDKDQDVGSQNLASYPVREMSHHTPHDAYSDTASLVAEDVSTTTETESRLLVLEKEKVALQCKKHLLRERLDKCSSPIMTRRFDTLTDLLAFERTLCRDAKVLGEARLLRNASV